MILLRRLITRKRHVTILFTRICMNVTLRLKNTGKEYAIMIGRICRYTIEGRQKNMLHSRKICIAWILAALVILLCAPALP